MPIYDKTAAHSFLRMLDPKNRLAPGDPARMAARIIESVDVQPAPLRKMLGSQALDSTLTTTAKADRRLRSTDGASRFHGLLARGVND
jgi:hypothetical protein